MQVLIVGSGDASNGAGRGHSCAWLEDAGSRPMMVDFGATALQGLRSLDRSPLELGAIVFTHLHGDHIGGYPFLHVDASYTTLRAEPLVLLGPVGTRARLEALVEVTYGGLLAKDPQFDIEWIELAPGEETQVLGATVTAFPALHMSPPEQPLCLRIRGQDGLTVAFSGDTMVCDGLLRAAEGVDLLIAECTGLAPPCGKHISWAEWRELLPTIGAKRVLLTHLSGEVRAEVERLLEEDRAGGGSVAFADDGLRIDL